jgi:pyruvate kinase
MGAYPVESVEMLARIAAAVEPTRRRDATRELYTGFNLIGRSLPEHVVAASVESSFDYLDPAAVFASTDTGATARRIAMFRLPAWIAAVSPSEKTCQDLHFSYGVISIHEPDPPKSWNGYVRDWVRRCGLPGEFALLTRLPGPEEGESNHRMEIIRL